jgi:hypothetical protein
MCNSPGGLCYSCTRMETKPKIFALTAGCLKAVVLLSMFIAVAEAAPVDFSCMDHMVRGKTPLTDRYKEYDVIITNGCPGPVYWTMCIERMDPLTHQILESHTPSGLIEEEAKSRVNVQMKKGPDRMGSQMRYQEFYLNIGYAIKPPASASCVAKACESQHKALRGQIDSNLVAWQKAEANLNNRLVAECPESGWGKTEEVEACESAVRQELGPELEQLAQTDTELREQLSSANNGSCQIYAGDLVE